MEIKAQLNYLRMSPRKVRLIAELIKGMDVAKAESQLKFLPKRASTPLLKLLQSAVSNAESNFNIKKDVLFVSKISVDGGPPLKRMRARAFGRAVQIWKRTSHIKLTLDIRHGADTSINDKAALQKSEEKLAGYQETKKEPERKRSEILKARPSPDGTKLKATRKPVNFVRRVFSRKAI